MEFLSEYGLFLLKALTIVVAFLVIFAGFFSISRKPKPKLEIECLNEHYEHLHFLMEKEALGSKPKKKKKAKETPPKAYLIEFNGDIKASQVEQLRQEINAILTVAKPEDEVIIRLESPGGSVNGYGLAAAQLQRIRDKNIPLTVCIDKVAASGGYLMACVANKIIAAPFAIIGSIGVVAQMPNFHRWLKKNNIDIELLTAGEYKRTLTLFGENTAKGREKFQEDLEQIHQAFRNYVLTHRQGLDIDAVSTGEHWLAQDAYALRLVDVLQTSDDYLMHRLPEYKICKITAHTKESLVNKLIKPAMSLLHPWA
ncbi:MAG: protease SohB [Legionella sp.]|nr:MAG: protease SohB [Legionella sp.]PJD99600.1 MAG: protease SohB [Legionella sp.]